MQADLWSGCETYFKTFPLPAGAWLRLGCPRMMFLDVCIILVCFSLLVAWYMPDDMFKVD